LSAAPQFPPDFRWPEEQPPQQPPLPPRRALWKRVMRGVAFVIGLVVILIAIAIPLLLHSAKFHQYVLRTAREKASDALQTQVSIRDYGLAFSGISPTLDVYGVSIAGAAPYSDTTVASVEHARLGVRIVSLLQRKWYLSDVEVHRPIVNVMVGRDGSSSLPKPQQKSSSKGNTNIFDLAIQHAILDGGAHLPAGGRISPDGARRCRARGDRLRRVRCAACSGPVPRGEPGIPGDPTDANARPAAGL